MAGDDPYLGVHQDWVVESELRDARYNLGNLGVRVRSRIFGVKDELIKWPVLNMIRHGAASSLSFQVTHTDSNELPPHAAKYSVW